MKQDRETKADMKRSKLRLTREVCLWKLGDDRQTLTYVPSIPVAQC